MTDTGLERRVTPRPVELRASDSGGLGVLSGYALVFNSISRDLGGWFEEVAPTAVGEAGTAGELDITRHARVIARAEHDSRLLLGTTDAGTLRVFVDETGVRYDVDLPDTSAGRDVAVLAQRGDLRYSSFAFHILPEGVEWREADDGRLVRRLTAITLSDVSPVADPAYWAATTGLRSIDLDAVRASLTPPPAGPGEREAAATNRARQIQTRIDAHASTHRPRKRGR